MAVVSFGFSKLSQFFCALNYGYLHRRVFVTTPSVNVGSLGALFVRVGAVTHYEAGPGSYGRRGLRWFLRYVSLRPGGFFFQYTLRLSGAFFVSLGALRSYVTARGGARLLLCTSRGLMTHHDCLRHRCGGFLVSLFV
jgi:hypothetical protein